MFSATDAKYVEKASKGDAHAWSQIIERYSNYVYTIVNSCGISESEAPDAFQYVFIELHRALPNLTNVDLLAPWIRQTTVRHCIKLRNKRTNQVSLDDQELSVHPQFDEDLQIAERSLMLTSSIADLKEKCRKLIHMLFYEDPVRPYQEIASELGMSIGSIGNTRIRCLDELKKQLDARGFE